MMMHTPVPIDEFATQRHDPYPWYAQLRATQPLYWTTLANGAPVLLVTRYADVLALLKDARLGKDVFQARQLPWWQRTLFARMNASNMLKSDPPAHTRLRRLASDIFQPRLTAQLRPQITQLAHQLIDRVAARGEMDFIRDFALPLPITVITDMLGVPSRDHARFHRWSNAIIQSGILSGERMFAGWDVVQLSIYMRRLIAQRRRHPGDDVLSQLLRAEYNGTRLDQLELVTTTILLLIAGHETTVNLLGNGLLALLQAPDQLARLRAQPELIPAAVEELLRYANPVQLVNRYAREDMQYAGVAIAKGTRIQLVLAAANHDGAVFAQGEELAIDRDTRRHLAFSHGIHYCLGAPLARLEGEVALTVLLQRLHDIQLVGSVEDLRWRPTRELRGVESLPIRFILNK